MSESDPCFGCDGDCDVCVCDGIGYSRSIPPAGLTYRLTDEMAVRLNEAMGRRAE